MTSKIFNLSMPVEFVTLIDIQAHLHFLTRSDYIKMTLLQRLKDDGVIPVPSLSMLPVSRSKETSGRPAVRSEGKDPELEKILEDFAKNAK